MYDRFILSDLLRFSHFLSTSPSLTHLFSTFSPLHSSPLGCLGVDSMVIAKILVHLRQTDRLPLGRIIAIHIDYANRAESAMEAQFVRDWCADLGIECFVRVVDEVTRGRCAHSLSPSSAHKLTFHLSSHLSSPLLFSLTLSYFSFPSSHPFRRNWP
jgi:PP-loop family